MEYITEQIIIWTPTISSVLGIIAAVLLTLGKVKKAIDDFKGSNIVKDLVNSDNALREDFNKVLQENQELKSYISILVDKITQIQGYCEVKENERKNKEI